MCKVFKVSRSGCYHWLRREPSKREQENSVLKEKIKDIYQDSKSRYGSPKITILLAQEGLKVSRPRVARIMQQEGLQSIIRKKYKVTTTQSNHSYQVAENHLNRDFYAEQPGQKWVSDIYGDA